MGIFYLTLSRLAGIGKMIAMKKCGNIASGAENGLKINLVRSLGCSLVSLIICAIAGFGEVSGLGMLFSILSGVANAALLFGWILCAERASLCAVEIFCMIGGVILPMVASLFIFEGESVGIAKWLASILLIVAAYLFSKKGGKERSGLSPAATALLLFTCVANAGCVLTQKLFSYYECGTATDFSLLTFLFCSLALGVAYLILLLLKRGRTSEEKGKTKAKKYIIVYILVAIVMLYSAQLLSTMSAELLEATLYFPLSYAIGMPLTFLTDTIVFKERIRLSSVIGLSLVILAIVFIGINF